MSDRKNELPDEPTDAVTPPLYKVVADQLDEVVYGEDPDVEEKS